MMRNKNRWETSSDEEHLSIEYLEWWAIPTDEKDWLMWDIDWGEILIDVKYP